MTLYDAAFDRERIFSKRIFRLLSSVVSTFELNLSGVTVLTEAASDYYALTPLLAAMAGARVFAVSTSTQYGKAKDFESLVSYGAQKWQLAEQIHFVSNKLDIASQAQIITNLGSVRPIDADFIAMLPYDAVICLMWEPWEYRKADLDLAACIQRGLPVAGTNETYPGCNIFHYLGPLVSHLLGQIDVEHCRNKIALIASEPFNFYICEYLERAGICVTLVERIELQSMNNSESYQFLNGVDAVVFAEHRSSEMHFNYSMHDFVMAMKELDIPLVHLSGLLDENYIKAHQIRKHPPVPVKLGHMSKTLSALGPKPVIELHAMGLKVGQLMYREFSVTRNCSSAVKRACETGLALDFDFW